MKNKHVGFLIVGISIVIGIIVLIFNVGLRGLLDKTCSMGASCTMYDALDAQTRISLAIAGLVFIIGLFFVFAGDNEKLIIRRIKQKIEVRRKPLDKSKLNKEEKVVVKFLEDSNGGMFQSDLVEKSKFGKVKVTRILDKLEGRQLIERKRRGMNNFVVLR